MIKAEDIKQLAFSNPIVSAALWMHTSKICSWEEALMTMVATLTEQNTRLVEDLVRAQARVPYVIQGPK